MGRAGKAKRHDVKMRMRRAAKAAKRTAYAALAGTSKKSKKLKALRSQGRKKFSAGKHRHLVSYCGNVGCKRCNPKLRGVRNSSSHPSVAQVAHA